ncbi:MAG: DUF4406 domain-containing protein [Eubacteriales bacterium]|nr:DUF4406 domain-containing protein [Eubacteriales bacterium]
MGISKYNSEGYYDPTTYEALSNIEKEEKAAKRAYRPLVYICSPFAGDVENNVNMARVYSRFAVRNACIPLAPHLLFPQFMDDSVSAERSIALFMGMVLLGKCDQIWVFGRNISAGMAAGIEKAEKKNMLIRYFTEELEEVKRV